MYEPGTIVLVPFPFTDLSAAKVRPAVVLAAPRGDDVVIALISSRSAKRKSVFSISLPASDTTGLKVASVVRVDKIATLEKRTILGELGRLSEAQRKQVNVKLNKLFRM